jgi:hypothetical protein
VDAFGTLPQNGVSNKYMQSLFRQLPQLEGRGRQFTGTVSREVHAPEHARPGFVWSIEASRALLCFGGVAQEPYVLRHQQSTPGRDQAL